MKRDGLIPDAPNLDALSAQHPRRKLTVVRLLWPKIRACLDRGHTVREIRERLRLDGLEVLRRLRKRNTALPVLILSGREQPEEKVTGLDLGADDYLVKPFSLSELQARVRALLRRGTGMATPTLQHGDLTFDTVARTASVGNRPLSLSLHEAGVLEVLLRRFGRVVSKEQLVEQLYSYDKEVSHNAIEVYIHRLRKKLPESGVEVRTHYGRGYVIDYVAR